MSDINPCIAIGCMRCCRDILIPLSIIEAEYLREAGAILEEDDRISLDLLSERGELYRLHGVCPKNENGRCVDKESPNRPKACGDFPFDGPVCKMLRR